MALNSLWGIPLRLQEVADSAKKGEPTRVSLRTFLTWFDAERRGWRVARRINEALLEMGLRTVPDFEGAHIDAEITIEARPQEKEPEPPADSEPVPHPTGHQNLQPGEQAPTSNESSEPPSVSAETRLHLVTDPIHRIGRLDSANRTLVSVAPDETTSRAITLMLLNDFSQLPVLRNERDCKGVVTWRSIAQAQALGRPSTYVRECMEQAALVDADKSIFEIIPTVVKYGAVFVVATNKTLQGIITTSDLGLQFGALGEPFLLIGEIENHLRRVIDQQIDKTHIQSVKDPGDPTRTISSAADLTFGEYKRLLETPERWDDLGTRLDRSTFVATLEEVREIRNDVMHFDPEGVGEKGLRKLREFVELMRVL